MKDTTYAPSKIMLKKGEKKETWQHKHKIVILFKLVRNNTDSGSLYLSLVPASNTLARNTNIWHINKYRIALITIVFRVSHSHTLHLLTDFYMYGTKRFQVLQLQVGG